MKIVIWNINGVKVWLEIVQEWLKEVLLDVVCFQEIKLVDENFLCQLFEDFGYNVEIYGQKGFNGVVILFKLLLEDVIWGLFGNDED